jgi:hypothetical protein
VPSYHPSGDETHRVSGTGHAHQTNLPAPDGTGSERWGRGRRGSAAPAGVDGEATNNRGYGGMAGEVTCRRDRQLRSDHLPRLLSDPAATYHDLGPDYYQHRLNIRRQARNRLQSLKRLGYHVTIHDINPDTGELLTATP